VCVRLCVFVCVGGCVYVCVFEQDTHIDTDTQTQTHRHTHTLKLPPLTYILGVRSHMGTHKYACADMGCEYICNLLPMNMMLNLPGGGRARDLPPPYK
jgi:hypothetical protein